MPLEANTAQNTQIQLVDSTKLDPTFTEELHNLTARFVYQQHAVDSTKWVIAGMVNDMWPEHAGIFSGNKQEFYIECSRVANDGLSVRIFGESGETLRRWCDVAATYENMPTAETFLDALSFDHLEKARKLARDGRIQAPDHALAVAVNEGLSADDMKERFDPSDAPHPYDVISGHLAYMADRSHWEFIKSADVRDAVLSHVTAIDTMVRIYLESEEKAI
jgi:hypothetical protein